MFFNSQSNGYGVGAQGMLLLYGCTEVPEILTTTPDETCGEGEVTLMATASSGTIKWYDAQTGGTLLGEGGSLTQTITETTSFWVEADDEGCVSSRAEVIGSFKEIPSILTTTPDETCGEGEVTLMATASAGTIKWYDAQTGGTLLGEGGSLTQSIFETTSFWVEADDEGCLSNRVEVIGTFKEIPEILTVTPGETCGTTASITATASAGTIMWYDAETGGNLLGFGGSLNVGLGALVTTFWVEVENNGCVSDRVEAGTFFLKPTILSTTPDDICGEGEVTLMATATAGIIKWYDSETGSTIIGEGESLTQNITETTSFWVEAGNDGCLSDRVEVVGMVLPLPDNTVTQADFVLTANQAGATYRWLDCNGSFLPDQTNQSFTVTENGSYAVEVTLGQCSVVSDCVVINNVGIFSPDEQEFKVFPNPTRNVVNIEVSAEYLGLTFSVFDRVGRVVKKGTLDSQVNTFDIGNLPNGLYFFIIDSSQKQVKIIKQ
jgi:preprotein translocase subunit Sec61beta